MPVLLRRTAAAFALAGVLASGGCTSLWPNLLHPGDTASQRSNALLHDPYADRDIGPPIVGGRPREYDKPAAEPVRSRYFRDSIPSGTIWAP